MNSLLNLLKAIERSRWMDYEPSSQDNPKRSLEMLRAFITGFYYGSSLKEDPRWLTTFTLWVRDHYDSLKEAGNEYTHIRTQVGGDDELAFDECFRLLALYEQDISQLGLEALGERLRQKRQKRVDGAVKKAPSEQEP